MSATLTRTRPPATRPSGRDVEVRRVPEVAAALAAEEPSRRTAPPGDGPLSATAEARPRGLGTAEIADILANLD